MPGFYSEGTILLSKRGPSQMQSWTLESIESMNVLVSLFVHVADLVRLVIA